MRTIALTRRYKKPNGQLGRIKVALCGCGAGHRGTFGGICVTCHGAISSIDEQRAINNLVWEQWCRDHPGWHDIVRKSLGNIVNGETT